MRGLGSVTKRLELGMVRGWIMAKKFDDRSTASDKVLRLFRILLSSDQRWFLYDLTKKLNCSTQTVTRLAEVIEREIGANLETGKDGRFRWYRLTPKAQPGHLPLEVRELRYLAICRDLAEPYLPAQLFMAFDRDLRRLALFLCDESNFPQPNKPFAFFSKGYIDYTLFFDEIDRIAQAIDEKMVLQLDYKALGADEVKHYLFAPHRIAGVNGALYVLGAVVNPDLSFSFRSSFAIHRINKVTLSGERFAVALTELDDRFYGLPWHEPRTFVIHFKAGKSTDYVRERMWTKNQRLRDLANGDLELELTTTAEAELLAWVRSFGSEAQLIAKVPEPLMLLKQDEVTTADVITPTQGED